MHEAFWNGLSGVRWEEAPLGPEAIRLVQRLRERGYAERTCRDYGHAVVHLGRYLHEELESDRVRDEGSSRTSYAGQLNFAAAADQDSCPDLDVFTHGVRTALDDLVQSVPMPAF
jgi:hypothetical protein